MRDLVTGLAILKVNWDRQGTDYMENFVPFLVDCLRALPRDDISLIEVSAVMQERFGLELPLGVLKTLLRRLSRRDIVSLAEGVYRVRREKLPEGDLLTLRQAATRQYEAFVASFMRFHADRLESPILRETADDLIATFLEDRSLSILKGFYELDPDRGFDNEAARYPLNAFVRHIALNEPAQFEFVVGLVKGTMLANAVFLENLGPIDRGFNRTKVFLDTRILLRVLGHAGSDLQAPYVALVSLLYATGAETCAFEDTVKEAKGILEANARDLRLGGRHAYGETFEHFVQSGQRSSDVLLHIGRMDSDLNDERITIQARPQHVVDLTVDELKLEDYLQDKVGYQNDEARLHDTDVIAAINTLRRGRAPMRLEDSAAVFVTTNTALVAAAVRFVRDRESGALKQAPLCVGDHTIGAMAWLKQPMRAPDLPRQVLIADCLAALNPPDPLWRAYLDEIDQLRKSGRVTEGDYEILRYTADAEQVLMDITFGEPTAFSEGTVEQVLSRAKASIREQTEAERDEARSTAANLESELQATRTNRDTLATEIRRNAEKQERAIRGRAMKWARRTRRAVASIAVATLIAALVLSLPKPIGSTAEHVPSAVVFILILVLALAGLASLLRGGSVQTWLRQFELWVQERATRTLTEWTGDAPGDVLNAEDAQR